MRLNVARYGYWFNGEKGLWVSVRERSQLRTDLYERAKYSDGTMKNYLKIKEEMECGSAWVGKDSNNEVAENSSKVDK